MRKLALRSALVFVSLTAGSALAAQETPTFHAGEWAAEFTGGAANSAGVMRFMNPRSALVFSFGGVLSRSTATPDGSEKAVSTTRNLNLALGIRRHTTVASRVLATTELGAQLGYFRQKTEVPGVFGDPLATSHQSQTSYGLYGEIGGQYFVASHLALGAVATLNANFSTGRNESGGSGTDFRALSLTTGLRPIRITLYF